MVLLARIPVNDNAAVLFEDQRLTYRELHARARRVAARLRQMGVRAETPVGLALERSLDLMPVILGIWYAGGAYVPIDPRHPRERRDAILRDAGIEVLVTAEWMRCLPVEEIEPVGLSADSLAYIIYTSGSTGQPNGVAVTHGSLSNFIEAVRVEMDVTEKDTVLAVGPVTFDISVMEIYLPLSAGARLALLSPGQDVHKEVARFDPTMMIATPATWRLLLQAGWKGRPDFKAVSAGDVLPRALANEILTRAGKLWNGYGPTETTAGAAFARVEPGEGPVPIGKAITNVELFVLDEAQRPCNEGELYIGGAGVARGYWNRPELTERRFLEMPIGRVYRTGDLVRVLPDRQLEFLGRVDDQVKLRGIRIEPGEIEAAMGLHPEVGAVAVTAADDRLSAHVVWKSSPNGSAERTLREFAEAKLPQHLWPSRILFLDALPLTANGKLDRRALARTGQEAPRVFVPPRTQIEKFLALIFAEVLNLERVGAEDNFFHLGGQSLLAAQVMARVWETWKAELPTSALFESPTVAKFACRIEGWQQKPRHSARIERRDARERQRPSFSQERLWFLQEFHQSPLYNLTLLVRLRGQLDIDRLQGALNGVVQRHEVLRTNFRIDEATVHERSIGIPLVCAQETERVFDLHKDALIRASVVQSGEHEYELMVSVHHIVFDGWSAGILFREVSALYADKPLEPLTIQYRDFAHWQRERLSGDVLARQLSYWRGKLDGLKGLLELPVDRPRPAIQTYRGAQFHFELETALSRSVEAFSRHEGATVLMTLLAAFQILLSRYTGESDICIGTAIAGRTRKEIENLIGLFINTLALRTSIPFTASFRDAISAVRGTLLEAIAHQEVPFERVVEALEPERTLSHTPFFQVMFTQLDLLPRALDLPGIDSGPVRMPTQHSRFDLSLNLDRTEPALGLTFEYNTDLFDESTIRRMAGHLETILAAAVAEPDRLIASLPVLTEREREQMLVEWNRTEAPIPERLPGAVQSSAFEPGSVVGVAVRRSQQLPEILRGIWEAGAAYVPLDPSLPKVRLELMMEDAGVNAVLTDDGLSKLWPPASRQTDIAYVIYTSGSTGTPKGVVVPRTAVLNLLEGMRVETGITERDVFLAVTTLSFDIAAMELFLPQYVGAKVVVATAEESADGRLLSERIDRSGATIMQATPATWRMLIDAGWRGRHGFKILCGGEALPRKLAEELLDRGAAVWNLFGPTETTIWSTACRVQRGEGPVPIGRPLANTKVFVLDPRQEPIPIGVPGELYIGGAGLARGYVNQPERTSERFLELPGLGRVYRTGDLVRWRADGQLEFIARLDHQVKLRGYRIELGEVESALLRHPQVQSAAVTCDGENLTAYFSGPVSDLRPFLAEMLPAYMIPSQFVQLDQLPLTPNGKLDRSKLPRARPQYKRERIAPRDELETRLSEIWAEVLRQPSGGITESFFEVGGHSLQAAQLVARIEVILGKRLTLPGFFAAPTIEGIAAFLRQSRKPMPEGLAPIQPEGSGNPLFMVEARSMFWRLGQILGSAQPFFGMHWPDPDLIPEPYSLGDIAAYYVRLIRSQQPKGPYTLGGWCLSAVVAFEIAQQLTAAGEHVEDLFLFDGVNPVAYPRTTISSVSWLKSSTSYHLSQMRKLRANQILPYIHERVKTIRRYSALRNRRRETHAEMDQFKNIETMAEFAVINYRPEPYAGRVTYFERGENPPLAGDPTFGWGPVMKGDFQTHKIPGNHAEMFQSPNVEQMAAIIIDRRR
jgi:amino acid adenylation domain-containing protein